MFNPVQIIARKRDGHALPPEEIAQFVRHYVDGDVPDYQMAALAMAICLRGMTNAETIALTEQMLASGATLEAADRTLRVDKHSTGGIGDKTSFIIAPLLACCGLHVPMISGRGLGATGGTLDKLESIPGVRTDFSRGEIQPILDQVGCIITSATADLVPADRMLYALRDVTATVPSVPLITASIMSKKLAENLSALVLDVKVGSGAFMKTRGQARELAECMVDVGARMGVATAALVTSMDTPLGRMVGNAVEIDESLDVLAGRGPADLEDLCLELAGEILVIKRRAADLGDAKAILREHLASGRALERFRSMIAAQGGDLEAKRPRAAAWTLASSRAGFVSSINAENLGLAIVEMDGGRKQLGQPIDHSVGLEMLVRVGEKVERGQGLMKIFASTVARSRGLRYLENAIEVGDQQPKPGPLVIERIGQRPPREPGQAAAPRVPGPLEQPAHRRTHRQATVVSPQRERELAAAALAACEAAYAPYSGYRVGAAVLSASDRIYQGSNVENASYGLTICAERVAFSTAVAAGEREFAMLAVASPGGAAPCGACRQFAAEFSPDLPVLLIDSNNLDERRATNLAALLPCQFSLRPPSAP